MTGKVLQTVKHGGQRKPVLLLQPSGGGFPARCTMAADFIPIAHLGWQFFHELIKNPCIELAIVFLPVISEGSFQLAVCLRVTPR